MTANRIISKSLAGRQDILFGNGQVAQQRAGGSYPINKVSMVWACETHAELLTLDTSQFTQATVNYQGAVTHWGWTGSHWYCQETDLTLVGSFETGFTYTAANQVGCIATDIYSWGGNLPQVVALGTDPTSVAGYVLRTDVVLREELTSDSGAGLLGFSHTLTYAASTAGFKLKGSVQITDHPYYVAGNASLSLKNALASSARYIIVPTGSWKFGEVDIPQNKVVILQGSVVTKTLSATYLFKCLGGPSYNTSKVIGGYYTAADRTVVTNVLLINEAYRTEFYPEYVEGWYKVFDNSSAAVSDYKCGGSWRNCFYGVYNLMGGINAIVEADIVETYSAVYVDNTSAAAAAEGVILRGLVAFCGSEANNLPAVLLKRADYARTQELMIDQSRFTPLVIQNSKYVEVSKNTYCAANNATAGQDIHGIDVAGDCSGSIIEARVEYTPSWGVKVLGTSVSQDIQLNTRHKNCGQSVASGDVFADNVTINALGLVSTSASASVALRTGAVLNWIGGSAAIAPNRDGTSLIRQVTAVDGIDRLQTGMGYGTVASDGTLSAYYGVSSATKSATGTYVINFATSQSWKQHLPRIHVQISGSAAFFWTISTINTTGFVIKTYNAAGVLTDVGFSFDVIG